MSYGPNAGDGADWESSFSQILNRTKHNLNRINQRYAPPTASSIDSAVLQPRGQFNNENTLNQQSLLLDRFSNTSNTFLQQRPPEPQGKPVSTVDTSVLERLNRLEEQLRASENASSHRLSNLDLSIESAVKGCGRSNQQVQDLEHTVTQLQNKITTLNGFVEVLQSENDSKRTVISKMDHWIRQGEIWREDLDGKVESLSKLAKSLDRTRNEQRELMAEHVTRYELEQLRDKMTVVTQQSVAASLSAWHDKMEQSVRNVERQIALLRIGMTDPDRSTGVLLTQDEVMAALATPLPSELLLKGTVANEVLQMENKLEEKLENRLQLFLKDRVEGTHNNLYKHLHQQLHNLCAEMGIDYPDVVPSASTSASFDPDATAAFRFDPEAEEASARSRQNYRIRLLEARKKSDDEIQDLNRTVDRLSAELSILQQSSVLDIKQHAAQVVHLERKVEECITVSANSVTSVADRSARLEEVVRETELSIRSTVNDTKTEFLERLSDLSRDWTTERAGLDRRLLVNERIAEDCLDRIKLSQSAVESYFKTSPEVKKFQRSAELVAQLQAQVNDVQAEVRSTSTVVHRLEANSAGKNEHLELRERVGRMEPTVLEKFPDYFESTKRVVDLSHILQSKVDKLDVQATHQHNDLQNTMNKLSEVDVLAVQLKGTTTVATEEIRRLTASVAEIDSTTRKDVNYLRDLAGSLSSRVVAVEGKVTLMNKTYAADSITTNNALARLTTSCEALEAHDVTAQNTLVQLQWALETEHKENVDHFATLKARLDLLQHVQEQHSARGPGADYGGANKSIEIKFTTDESGEMDDHGEGYVTTSYSTHNSPRRSASQKSPHAPPVGSPQVTKTTHRGGSAFLTESEPSLSASSSPDKSHSFLQAYEVFKKAEESRLSSAQNSPVRTGSESPNKPTRRSFDFDQSSVHSTPTAGGAKMNTSATAGTNVTHSSVNTSGSAVKTPSPSVSLDNSAAKTASSANTTVNTSVNSSTSNVAPVNVSAATQRSANTSAHTAVDMVNTSTVSTAASIAPVALQEDEESELSFEREERLQASFARSSPPLSSAEQSPSSLRRSHDREDSPEPSQDRHQQDNSWDESQLSPEKQDNHNESVSGNDMSQIAKTPSQDVSSSRIPMHSAFDMSMPSYVSHIDSSGDANQSSFDYPIHSEQGSAAVSGSDNDSPSDSPAGKLSIGSEDSLENLSTTFEEMRKHKEALLETTRSAQKLSANNSNNHSFASPSSVPTSPLAPPQLETTSQSMRYEEESESDDDHSEADLHKSGGAHSDQDSDLEDDEFDHDSGSGPGDFSQIDMTLPGEVSVAPPAEAAVSMVNNSWDASSLPDSPEPARSTSNQSAVNMSTASNLSASTASSTASSAAGRAKIPSLNMASLPPSSPNLEPPSDRSVNRNQPDRTGVSDWDAESSFASDSTGATPPRPLNASRQGAVSKALVPPISLPVMAATASESNVSNLDEGPSFDRSSSDSDLKADDAQSPDRLNRSAASFPSQTQISALDMSSIDHSPPRALQPSQLNTSQSKIIGASDASPAPKSRPGFDDSTLSGTAGSVSDSSASTSDYSASSHSYLTVGSISPQKGVNPPVVPAAATAKPTAPVATEPAMSVASSVSISTLSSVAVPPVAATPAPAAVAAAALDTSKMSIKDRLKHRQELLKLQKKAADSANVSSAASVASSVDNGVMSFEAFDDSQG